MPIRPENRSRYPADWPEIRRRILERAGYRCEHPGCVARQYSVGWWFSGKPVHDWTWIPIWGDNNNPRTYAEARAVAADKQFGAGNIVIVLTIAHLDHQPENCADDNLRALCQRHHLAHDHHHHLANAQATRRAKSGTLELF